MTLPSEAEFEPVTLHREGAAHWKRIHYVGLFAVNGRAGKL